MKRLARIVTLFAAVCMAAGCASVRMKDGRDGFVSLAEAVPDVILEIRYYSTYNFVGERIDGYEQPCALILKEAAAALKAASDMDAQAMGGVGEETGVKGMRLSPMARQGGREAPRRRA